MEELWIKTKRLIKEQLRPHVFSMWIEGLRFVSGEHDLLTLSTPNDFSKKRIEEAHLPMIKNVWEKVSGQAIEIGLIVKESKKTTAQDITQQVHVAKPHFDFRSKNPRPLRESFSFKAFVTGPQNIVAYQAAMAIASSENGNVPNGILLFLSQNGLGKTHLSQSTVNLRHEKYPELKVFYLTVQDFTDAMTRAMRTGGNFAQNTFAVETFKKNFMGADLFVLDEVDHLTGKARTQKELAFIIDHLMDRDKKIIFCSNTHPSEIKKVDNKMRSLLNFAPIITIDAPDQETRAKIFSQKAALWGCSIPNDVVEFLAESVRGDVRKIEGTLSQLMLHSQAHKKPINLFFAQRVLEAMLLQQEGVTPSFIMDLVSKTFNVPVADIKSRSKKQSFVWPRYVIIHLLLTHTQLTYEAIGKLVNRTHASIPRVPNEIKRQTATNTSKKLQLEHVEELLKKRLAL